MVSGMSILETINKWQKLSTAASYYGYKFKAHDSLEDVRATLYVYKKLQAQESGL